MSDPIRPDLTKDTTFTVRWTYIDSFEKTRWESFGPLNTVEEAQRIAEALFAETEPDAWWIEAVTTVEYHDPQHDRDAAKDAIRAERARALAEQTDPETA